MKIRASITAIEDTGDQLDVTVHGVEESAAGWRPQSIMHFKIANIEVRRRALYVGRELIIEIKPR